MVAPCVQSGNNQRGRERERGVDTIATYIASSSFSSLPLLLLLFLPPAALLSSLSSFTTPILLNQARPPVLRRSCRLESPRVSRRFPFPPRASFRFDNFHSSDRFGEGKRRFDRDRETGPREGGEGGGGRKVMEGKMGRKRILRRRGYLTEGG